MNERIQELMKQAMEPSGLEGLGGPYMELNPEKFAELIVQECIHTVESHGGMGGAVAGDKIRKQFGVKS